MRAKEGTLGGIIDPVRFHNKVMKGFFLFNLDSRGAASDDYLFKELCRFPVYLALCLQPSAEMLGSSSFLAQTDTFLGVAFSNVGHQ